MTGPREGVSAKPLGGYVVVREPNQYGVAMIPVWAGRIWPNAEDARALILLNVMPNQQRHYTVEPIGGGAGESVTSEVERLRSALDELEQATKETCTDRTAEAFGKAEGIGFAIAIMRRALSTSPGTQTGGAR